MHSQILWAPLGRPSEFIEEDIESLKNKKSCLWLAVSEQLRFILR